MAGAYLAVSCIASALTRTQVVSFILAVFACLALLLIGFPPAVQAMSVKIGPQLAKAISSLSFLTHFDSFQKGVLDSRDVIFFLSIAGFSLFTTSVILRGHRAG
jgi:ABC-2 type transport system permease protein